MVILYEGNRMPDFFVFDGIFEPATGEFFPNIY